MQFGLVISVILHAAILGWALITIQSQRELAHVRARPIITDLVTESELTKLRQGARTAKQLEAMAKEAPRPTSPRRKRPSPSLSPLRRRLRRRPSRPRPRPIRSPRSLLRPSLRHRRLRRPPAEEQKKIEDAQGVRSSALPRRSSRSKDCARPRRNARPRNSKRRAAQGRGAAQGRRTAQGRRAAPRRGAAAGRGEEARWTSSASRPS